ncbi:MAG: beta/gamma crystallin-related protein [Rhodoferax sp.]|uniref:beta/gamma crystallin-related protein n=1 Tax=Rhodoferax sp. TaxID=50421 RepID=UPI0026331857|nr:beta/gamma crystallin-related protein [Rhodoferax sp.]MDD2879309.1 beta/gamma crystallin-related protein [Rhodoferax sp.]
MTSSVKTLFAVAAVAMAAQASAQVTFYEQGNFQGRSFTTQRQINNFERFGFNDRASSVEVIGNRWEVCEDTQFRGRCVVLRPGKYPSLAAMGLNDRVSSVKAINRNARVDERRYAPAPAVTQVTFYQQENFGGPSFSTSQGVLNFQTQNFNDRASSVLVTGGQWEVCEDARFGGRCAILREGRYPSLAAVGLSNRISSTRLVSNEAPNAAMAPDYRQRTNERLYEATVTSTRAVVGTPEQRCWVEKEQIPQAQSNSNVPAAIAGALIGGILGHQVGGGTGKDLATVGGAIAGAAVGNSVGRNGNTDQATTRDVQRCENVSGQARPQYWDVTYTFRGVDHRVQMTTPPGPTVTVNAQGEPRAQR